VGPSKKSHWSKEGEGVWVEDVSVKGAKRYKRLTRTKGAPSLEERERWPVYGKS